MVGIVAKSRKHAQKYMPSYSAVDPYVHKSLDRSTHNPGFFQLRDTLLPHQAVAGRCRLYAGRGEGGRRRHVGLHRVCRRREAATETGHELQVYVRVQMVAKTLAMQEDTVATEAVKLAALERRRCVRHRTSPTLSLLAGKVARDLDDPTCRRAATPRAPSPRTVLVPPSGTSISPRGEFDRHSERAAANVKILQ